MNKAWVQILIILIVLIGTGEITRTIEQDLTTELQEKKFIRSPLTQENRLKLGQTGAAVVLGGLRSLVAAFMNLEAFGKYDQKDWVELERLYEIIVTLQPNNIYYWETASWHLAYNAYFDFDEKLGMAAPRRRLKQKEYLQKGESFLLRAVHENPEESRLWVQLARLFSDPHKPYDFTKAAHYLSQATQLPDAKPFNHREYFYSLGRVKGKEEEALKLGIQLISDPRHNKFSSLRTLFFTLAMMKNPGLTHNDDLINSIWVHDKHRAYKDLVNYWKRTEREGFPPGYTEQELKKLITELNIPDQWNPFKNPNLKRITGNLPH